MLIEQADVNVKDEGFLLCIRHRLSLVESTFLLSRWEENEFSQRESFSEHVENKNSQ